MDLVILLGQQGPSWWESPETVILGRAYPYPPYIAVPALLVLLFLASVIVERVIVVLLRRLTAKTVSKVDDALVDGLPMIVRPLFILLALRVLVVSFVRSEKERSETGDFATNALTFITIVVVALALTRVMLRVCDAWAEAEVRRRPLAAPFKFAIKFVMVPLTIFTAVDAVGAIPLGTLLTSTAFASLAVGLALQDTLKNMFAGIQIILDRPIRVGDQIEIDRNVRGTVVEIGLRTTRLRSAENHSVIIPNATIANAMITNLDAVDRSYIQSFEVGVAYGSDVRRVQAVLEEVASEAVKSIDGLAADSPRVWLRGLGDSALQFTVDLRFRQWAGRLALITEVHHRLYERLQREGIEIPYPTRTVHLRGPEPAAGERLPA